MEEQVVVLGVGNVLEKDDGIGVYAAAFLEANYRFDPPVHIINGGVEGINLLNLFMENRIILILDTLLLEDDPGSTYAIPSFELGGMGLNSGGAHEIGVLQCLDMIALLGKEAPEATVIGIVPQSITFDMDLSETLKAQFDTFVATALRVLERHGVGASAHSDITTVEMIIERFRDPSSP
jgi:hydrogenase maturation protease